MHNRKLTFEHLERGESHKTFTHLQNLAGLQAHGKARVDEAMNAAIAHVQKKHDLRLGITNKHVDEALNFLQHHYEGRRLLKPKEKDVIKHSLDIFFDRKPDEPEVEKEVAPLAQIETKTTPRTEPQYPRQLPGASNDGQFEQVA